MINMGHIRTNRDIYVGKKKKAALGSLKSQLLGLLCSLNLFEICLNLRPEEETSFCFLRLSFRRH